MLVGACEDFLEDILGVVGAQAETLPDDRVDVAGEAVDELAPRRLVACAAPSNEPGIGQRSEHARKITARSSVQEAWSPTAVAPSIASVTRTYCAAPGAESSPRLSPRAAERNAVRALPSSANGSDLLRARRSRPTGTL